MRIEYTRASSNRLRSLFATMVAIAFVAFASGCAKTDDATRPPAAGTRVPGTTSGTEPPFTGALPKPEVVANGLSVPWGIAFLPDGDALIAERDTARILRSSPGQKPVEAMRLNDIEASAEGGLLGLAVSPNYASDQLVYAYYSTKGDNRIARFRLGGAEEVIVEGISSAAIHDGGRLQFGPDGLLYATTGDAGNRESAQDLDSLSGKILRMNPDGSAAARNPFAGSRVYSYGHRNVQGLTWDNQGRLWSAEFGQNAFDEVNLITPGANYGWPAVEGTGDTDGGRYTNPVVTWRTAEASPSGIAYWRGALYVAALRGQRLWRITVGADGKAGTPEALLTGEYGRLRTVVVEPDGSLWVSTSNTDGRGQPKPEDDQILRFV